ncbi:MAG: hypothetical protein M3N30_02425 [Bacteroidota bacterium]|nr:hypothetical protein [Bacteroidota bacterium]
MTFCLQLMNKIWPITEIPMQISPKTDRKSGIFKKQLLIVLFLIIAGVVGLYYFQAYGSRNLFHRNSGQWSAQRIDTVRNKDSLVLEFRPAVLDTVKYDQLLRALSNGDSSGRWPVKLKYPLPGAIFPFNRVIAYYGNFYSKRMGVLGEYPTDTMFAKLKAELKKWQAADSTVPVRPALHYIAVTAQGYPGKGNKYRLRMPFKQIDSVIRMAARINALVFLDIQVGMSTVQDEVPLLEPYLKMPQVHLGIDPEFSMKTGKKPGSVIGTMNDSDINFTIRYLANLAKANQLPPKILVVHRFTQAMIRNYKNIKPTPEVQVVIDMDGWGAKSRKLTTYREYVSKEPVQFTGFKLFYKNDFREAGSSMMTPVEVLKLKPRPVYIQYQ